MRNFFSQGVSKKYGWKAVVALSIVGVKIGSAGLTNQEKPFCELLGEKSLRKSCFGTLEGGIKHGRHH